MKTKYDIGETVLIKAVVTGITIKKRGGQIIEYEIKTDKARTPDWELPTLEIDEKDIVQIPDEFNGCDNCKHDRVPMTAYPCSDCEHNHISHYEPKEDEDVIDE